MRNGADGKGAILRMSRTGIEPVTRCLKVFPEAFNTPSLNT